jgi:hypothetical protein
VILFFRSPPLRLRFLAGLAALAALAGCNLIEEPNFSEEDEAAVARLLSQSTLPATLSGWVLISTPADGSQVFDAAVAATTVVTGTCSEEGATVEIQATGTSSTHGTVIGAATGRASPKAQGVSRQISSWI